MAAGGFVNRAFESMLKECSSTKKYPDLQKAIQTYIGADCTKVVPQPSKSSDETAQVTDSSAGNESAIESDGGAARTELDQSQTQEGISRNITTVLANAGCSLEGSEAELVLYPLRLAVESKNLKILEPALDCLHVCNLLYSYGLLDSLL